MHPLLMESGYAAPCMTPSSIPTWNILEKTCSFMHDKRMKMVITDGVFSMDGDTAKLDEMVELCEKYDAMIFVDDSHSSGFIGKTGRGTHEQCGVMGKIDIITTTFGKALGGHPVVVFQAERNWLKCAGKEPVLIFSQIPLLRWLFPVF